MSVSPPRSAPAPVLSVVIPLFNEEAVLDTTYRRLKEQLDRLGESYEILFVDDGSTDRSRETLAAASGNDPTVRIVVLSRNFGHEMATTAGLLHARGQAAIVMDADLQDPPELIAQFVEKWRQGHHVVYGVRREREGESALKKLTSFVFYRLLGRLADAPIPADTGDFRLLDRRVLDVYRQFQEDPRFFRGLVSWIGFRQIGVPFTRRPRAGGQTKYRYGRLIKLAFDTITAFSTAPALCITLLAFGLAAASAAFFGSIVLLWAFGIVMLKGWMWAALGFLFLWNLQFLSVSVLGEYIVRTHRHTQRRPLFVVDTVIENPTPSPDDRIARQQPEVTLACYPSALCTE